MSKLSIFYGIVASVIVTLFTYSMATGYELGSPAKQTTTAEAKKSGYRGGGFIFIYSGGGGFRGK